MKVTLVHDWLTGMRGGEKCLEALAELFPRAELLTLLHRRGSTSPPIERMRIRTSWLGKLPMIERYYRATLPLMPRAIASLRVANDSELVVSLSHAVAKGVTVPAGVPHVCYCFTPMRYAWERRDDYVGRNSLSTWMTHRLLDQLQAWDRGTAERVTHFIAISREVQRRIERCYGRSSDVIYPPVDTDYYTPDARIARDDYYLCVSALVPYKRLEQAIAACRRLDRRLVIIGQGPELARLTSLADDRITLLGWQSDETIRAHLRRCRALLFPGHEDFGIVPLEAQACGAPVIALGRGGAEETVLDARRTENGTGVLYEAGSPDNSLSGSRQRHEALLHDASRPACGCATRTTSCPGHPAMGRATHDNAGRGTGVLYEQPTVESLCDAIDWFEQHPSSCDPTRSRTHAERFSRPRFIEQLRDYLDRVMGRHGGHSNSCAPAPRTLSTT